MVLQHLQDFGIQRVSPGPLSPVEISGYSHFFGFERPYRPGQPSEYLTNNPNCHVGMTFAKNPPDEASF